MNVQRVAGAAVTVIAGVTVLTGAVQAVAPGPVLRLVGAEDRPATRHLFLTVGMLMAVVGGLVLDAQRGPTIDRRALLWGGLQKVGASSAVGLGVARGVFGPQALVVASLDLLSGALFLGYRQWARNR